MATKTILKKTGDVKKKKKKLHGVSLSLDTFRGLV